jgi:LysR family nitrogen assimilation transcriptional regulator
VRTGIGHTILNIGELHGPNAASLAKPLIVEPPITMTCSVISSGDFNLSGAGEAVRGLVADVIRSFIKTTKRPGATLVG